MVQNIDTIVEELEEYANYENTERREYWEALTRLWKVAIYYYDEVFFLALEEEIRNVHEYIKVNYEWIEKTENITRVHKKLVWKE